MKILISRKNFRNAEYVIEEREVTRGSYRTKEYYLKGKLVGRQEVDGDVHFVVSYLEEALGGRHRK